MLQNLFSVSPRLSAQRMTRFLTDSSMESNLRETGGGIFGWAPTRYKRICATTFRTKGTTVMSSTTSNFLLNSAFMLSTVSFRDLTISVRDLIAAASPDSNTTVHFFEPTCHLSSSICIDRSPL